MALKRTYLGRHPEGHDFAGQPHYRYESDQPLIYVGPYVAGEVTLDDGTVYDVSQDVVEAPLEHHGQISHHVGMKLEREGHPLHKDPETPFVHECNEHCGPSKRKAK